MPSIKCDVVKCVFNTHGGCSREHIEVEKNCEAHECCETFCESFSDKISEVKNSACTDGCPCEDADIDCDVTNCSYNENKICTAHGIHVGTSYASTAEKTQCETFTEKQ